MKERERERERERKRKKEKEKKETERKEKEKEREGTAKEGEEWPAARSHSAPASNDCTWSQRVREREPM